MEFIWRKGKTPAEITTRDIQEYILYLKKEKKLAAGTIKGWYSYCKRTFDGPLAVIKYLGRYTHRIAIANSRIVDVNEQIVTFKVRDNKDGQREKTCTLSGTEFVRRFLMHVLPKGFRKIRYYGLMATRNKPTKLALCRKLTQSPCYQPKYAGLTVIEILFILLGRDVTKCPRCQNSMRRSPLGGSSP